MLEPLAALDRYAAERPDSIALTTPRRDYTFGQLKTAVEAVAERLDGTVTDGMIVGVDLPTAQEWIVDLALFRLAAVSVSLRGVRSASPVDLLITTPGRREGVSSAVIEVDELWLDSAVAAASGSAPLVEFASDDAIVRLILTSGTTGSAKSAAYSLAAMRYRIAEGHLHWTDGRPELTLIGLSTTGGFHAALGSLALGVPYLAIDRIDAESLAFAARQGIQVLCGSPTQVAHALGVLGESGLTLPTLGEVRLAGAGPSPALLQHITDTLGVPVVGVYGSTEGGGVSMLTLQVDGDRFDVGRPLPEVELELELIDPDDRGEGLIRYRTPGLVSGYLVDGTVAPLPGGWFVPGDVGRLTDAGSLVLAGRDSELLNVGGIKLDPVTVDDLATAFAGVRDAAAFGVERRPGLPEVGLAVVTEEGTDLRALDAELRAQLPIGHPTAYWRVSEIPRGRLGKPLRAQLSAELGGPQ